MAMNLNMGNMGAILKLKKHWDKFRKEHPKFPAFITAVKKKGFKEGTVIEVTITDPDGEVLNTNLKLTAADLEMFKDLSQMGMGM